MYDALITTAGYMVNAALCPIIEEPKKKSILQSNYIHIASYAIAKYFPLLFIISYHMMLTG